MTGIVKSVDETNNSGIITCSATGDEVTFYFSAIGSTRHRLLHAGQKVSFYVKSGSQDDGKLYATNVTAIE